MTSPSINLADEFSTLGSSQAKSRARQLANNIFFIIFNLFKRYERYLCLKLIIINHNIANVF